MIATLLLLVAACQDSATGTADVALADTATDAGPDVMLDSGASDATDVSDAGDADVTSADTATDADPEVVLDSGPSDATDVSDAGDAETDGSCTCNANDPCVVAECLPDGDCVYTPVDSPLCGKNCAPALKLVGTLDAGIEAPTSPAIAWAQHLVVENHIAYIASGLGSVYLVDVSDPTSPTVLSTVSTSGSSVRLRLSWPTVYVADGPGGVAVIDVADPLAPTLVAQVPTPDDALGLDVVGDVAYVTGRYADLWILDIADPAQPVLLSELGGGSKPHQEISRGVVVQSSLAYYGGYSGLYIADVSDASAPVLLGGIGNTNTPGASIQGTPGEVILDDDTAYVLTGNFGGVFILDVADPSAITVLKKMNFTGAYGIHVTSPWLLLGLGIYLQVHDLTETQPFLPPASITTQNFPLDVFAHGPYAYVADGTALLSIYYVACSPQ